MNDKSKYYITETAGDWVAGRRSPGFRKTIELTEAQAKTPLLNGEIATEKPVAKSTQSHRSKRRTSSARTSAIAARSLSGA